MKRIDKLLNKLERNTAPDVLQIKTQITHDLKQIKTHMLAINTLRKSITSELSQLNSGSWIRWAKRIGIALLAYIGGALT